MPMAQYGMGFLLSLKQTKGGECQVVILYQGKNSIFWLINICLNSSFDSLFCPPSKFVYNFYRRHSFLLIGEYPAQFYGARH